MRRDRKIHISQMPIPFRPIAELASLFRYWQRHPLASRDLPGTVARLLRWQLGSRLLRMPMIVPWMGRAPRWDRNRHDRRHYEPLLRSA